MWEAALRVLGPFGSWGRLSAVSRRRRPMIAPVVVRPMTSTALGQVDYWL